MPTTVLPQPTHKSNEVKFNDGEGLDFSDINDVQRFLKTYVMDGMLGAEGRTDLKPLVETAETQFAFCPQACVGYPKPDAAAMTITNREGTVCQWTASGVGTGTAPKFLKYQLDEDELLTVIDDNTSGNPRIDLIAILLEEVSTDSQSRDFEDATTEAKTTEVFDKKIRVRATKNYVVGTPAATPTPPATPGGYAAYAYVYVPNNFTLAGVDVFVLGNLSDQRIPLRVKSCTVFAKDAILGSNASLSSDRSQIDFSAAGTVWFPLPLGPDARILRVDIAGDGGGGANATAFMRRLIFTATPFTVYNFIWDETVTASYQLENPDSNFSTPVTNGGTALKGPAFWGNGYACGMAAHEIATGATRLNAMAVEVNDTGGASDFDTFFVRVFYAA